MDADELAAWLALADTPGVPRAVARQLLMLFGSPERVRAIPFAALRELAGEPVAQALRRGFDTALPRARATLRWGTEAAGSPRAVVPLGDAHYPAALLESADPPLLLHVEGRLALLQRPAVAIVGSRRPTPQGSENARAFARGLGEAGYTVVSGLALGIDAAAHEGALGTPGSTLAVMGCGLDTAYPRRHAGLARRVAADGLLASEHAPGTPPLAHHFPRRNRVIAGLARATLVVEAALPSGSLITARLALEAGRDVLAIPGSIHSPLSRGCHALLKQGAALVESVDDVLQELGGPALAEGAPAPARPGMPAPATGPGFGPATGSATAPATGPASATTDEPVDEALLHALGHDPVGLDVLHARTGAPAPQLLARLLALELAGHIARLPGQRFQRLAAS